MAKARTPPDLKAFNDNYLAHAQHAEVTAISYPVLQNFATNTGLMSGYDLNLDGKVNSGPDDAWGFGNYHGQYAFAVMSKYPIDTKQIRTFQNFKWKDMPGEKNPVIDDCNNPNAKIPASRQCGDAWYANEVWQKYPLSSKNHADVPVRIKTDKGEEVIHFLISHPTPPIFANAARHTVKHNRAEIAFWNDYVKGLNYMADDKGTKGGLAKNAKFVIAGDLNADPQTGDGDLSAIPGSAEQPADESGHHQWHPDPGQRRRPGVCQQGDRLQTQPQSSQPGGGSPTPACCSWITSSPQRISTQ